jgi:hypothetical protein
MPRQETHVLDGNRHVENKIVFFPHMTSIDLNLPNRELYWASEIFSGFVSEERT